MRVHLPHEIHGEDADDDLAHRDIFAERDDLACGDVLVADAHPAPLRDHVLRVPDNAHPDIVEALPSGVAGVLVDPRLNEPLVGREFFLPDRRLIDRALPTKAAPMDVAVGAVAGRRFGCASVGAACSRHLECRFFEALP